MLKGTEHVISNDLPFIKLHVRFTKVSTDPDLRGKISKNGKKNFVTPTNQI